jgi:hypothetical protein
MSVWSIAAAAVLAGAAAGVTRHAAQDPQPAPSVTVVSQAEPMGDQEENQQRVSASFDHAGVSEVMDWLTKNGVSFVSADSELPKDATITLNVKDQPINQVVDAIADALGGHWQRRGEMRVFRKGQGFDVFRGGDNMTWNMAPDGKAWSTGPGSNMKVFTGKDGNRVFMMPDMPDTSKMGDMPNVQVWNGPDMEKLKLRLKDMPGMDENARREMEKAMKESRGAWTKNGEQWKVSQKAMEEAHKAMEKAMKEHPEGFSGNSFFDGDEKSMAEARKEMERARVEMQKAMKQHPEAFNGKIFMSPDNGDFFKVQPDGKGRTFHYRVGKGSNNFAPSVTINGKSFTRFMDSLSDEQREQNRRQGYILARDLSAAQKKLLGINGEEKGWSITVSKDGEKVTVKSGD